MCLLSGYILESYGVLTMDIYDYKKRLEKVENKIRNSSISDKNKKIIFNFEKQMFIKELSMPRIERCISIIGIISEKLGKDLDCLEKKISKN